MVALLFTTNKFGWRGSPMNMFRFVGHTYRTWVQPADLILAHRYSGNSVSSSSPSKYSKSEIVKLAHNIQRRHAGRSGVPRFGRDAVLRSSVTHCHMSMTITFNGLFVGLFMCHHWFDSIQLSETVCKLRADFMIDTLTDRIDDGMGWLQNKRWRRLL